MKFNPPPIESIKQVLPIVQDNPAFIVREKDWYTVIDYMYMTDKLFHCEIERECRGIKFSSRTGRILARPYHKFHNLNERPDYATANVDLSQPHIILDKLDGSMVHTCATPMGIYLMTRMGVTEVAEKADKFLCANPVKFSRLFNYLSPDFYTFIFEYVAPTNKIVLDYAEEDLILTAIRHTVNGTYLFYDELQELAKASGVKLVEAFPFEGFDNNMERIAGNIAEQTNTEGYVIRFDTGAMLKIKCDEYVRKHRTKDLISSPKGICSLIVENNLDDVLPQLDEGVQKQAVEYQSKILGKIEHLAINLAFFVKAREEYSQKDFALDVQKLIARPLQSVAFLIRKGCDPQTELLNLLRKNCGTNKRITELLTNLEFPLWTFSFFAEE
jgi:RNA ligase